MGADWFQRDPIEYKRDAVRVTIALTVVVLCVKACEPFFTTNTQKENSIARRLLEQAMEWYRTSLQDQGAQNKYQHVSYAAAYLHAARYTMNDRELERITGSDVHALSMAIDALQTQAHKELIKRCPKLKELSTVPVPAKRKAWI